MQDRPPTIDEQVLVEQTRLVFDRSRLSGILKVPFALLVCWLLREHSPPLLLTTWFVALTATTIWRVLVDLRHARAPNAQAPFWLRQFQISLAFDGLCFGMIGFLVHDDPNSPIAIMMVATVIAAESIAFVVLSAHLGTMLTHTLPALLPNIVWQAARGTDAGIFVGAGGAVFVALIISDGKAAYEHTRDMLRLRFQMDELAAQRAQALELAERHSAVKSRFLATMSHEIRTPLHGILGIARLLRSEAGRGAGQARNEHLDTLRLTGEHLLSVINDALDFSSIESGRVALQSRDYDLARLVLDVADLSRVTASEKGLGFGVDLSVPTPCWVRGDPARLRQILLNLTGNAVKFTDAGTVSMHVHRFDDGATLITVNDTGSGIPPSELETIFDAFHQADASYGRRHGGTGLGLTIARELARAMGGDLVCTSTIGQGSSFMLTLPLPAGEPQAAGIDEAPAATLADDAQAWGDARAAQAAPGEGAAAGALASPIRPAGEPALRAAATDPLANIDDDAIDAAGSAGRVLLVDDNRLNAYVAENLLIEAGLSVDCAQDGAEAIEMARARAYDLILMDCQMPVIDGFEATRRIREEERTSGRTPVPIIALTANALQVDRQRSLDAGMNDHLAKPFGEAELEAVVRRYARRKVAPA